MTRSMHTLISLLFQLVLALSATVCRAVPLDGWAIPLTKHLEALMMRPVEARKLTPDEVAKYVTMLKTVKTCDVAICAALLLAWADDQESLTALSSITNSMHASILGSAATYALGIRELRLPKKDYYIGLCNAVRSAEDPDELLFYANRLWGDFGKRGLPVIFEAAKSCEDECVMQELLSYVSETDSVDLAKKASQYPWVGSGGWGGAENIEMILTRSAPNQPPRMGLSRSKAVSLGRLQKMLKKAP